MNIERYNQLGEILLNILGVSSPEMMRILIVGAGKGEEALALSQSFPLLTAIEPNIDGVLPEARDLVHFGSATALEYPDESFDIVYCYHVLEHIDKPELALREMNRVLKNDGTLFLGVPNKNRLIGYVCVGNTSWRNKLMWNLIDWKMRATGRFENRYGAHAGYTRKELSTDLSRFYDEPREVTKTYYGLKWPGSRVVKLISACAILGEFIWPSIYFVAKKSKSHD